jgi:hypothetical protein
MGIHRGFMAVVVDAPESLRVLAENRRHFKPMAWGLSEIPGMDAGPFFWGT